VGRSYLSVRAAEGESKYLLYVLYLYCDITRHLVASHYFTENFSNKSISQQTKHTHVYYTHTNIHTHTHTHTHTNTHILPHTATFSAGSWFRVATAVGACATQQQSERSSAPLSVTSEGDGILCVVILCYVMLCYVMLCYVVLCYIMLCYVMLCHVMSCFVAKERCFMLFYVVLYHIVLYHVKICCVK
jgi:hypothetical protein